MTKVGTKISQIREKEKELKNKRQELIDSCKHEGDFTIEVLGKPAFLSEDHNFELECKCHDCDKTFLKKFDYKEELYNFRRENLKNFSKKDSLLLDLLSDIYYDCKERGNYFSNRIFWEAVKSVESGRELQSIFSGEHVNWDKISSYSEGFQKICRKYLGDYKKRYLIDDFFGFCVDADFKIYSKLKKYIDHLMEPTAKAVGKHWTEKKDKYGAMEKKYHVFSQVFFGTKTLRHDVIRILENGNYPRLHKVGEKVEKGEERYKFTIKDKVKTIELAVEMYEKENGNKPDSIIINLESFEDQVPKGFKKKEGQRYLPNQDAHLYYQDDNWHFNQWFKRVGTYRGLKVFHSKDVHEGKSIGTFQVIALSESDLDLNPDHKFPRVANYHLVDCNVVYDGFFRKF